MTAVYHLSPENEDDTVLESSKSDRLSKSTTVPGFRDARGKGTGDLIG